LNKIAIQQPEKIVLMHAINDLNVYTFSPDYWGVHGAKSNLITVSSGLERIATRMFPVLFPYLNRFATTEKRNMKLNDIEADLKEFYTMTAPKEYSALSRFLLWHMKLLLIS
jgi:hypothetical protein